MLIGILTTHASHVAACTGARMHVTSSKNLHNGPTCVKFGIVSCILEIRLQYFKTNNIGNTSSKETDFSKLGWPFRYPISKRSRCSPIFLHFLTRTTHYLAVAKVARTSLKTQYCPLCFTRLCYCPFFCTEARLLLFSGVLLFSWQAFNCAERN